MSSPLGGVGGGANSSNTGGAAGGAKRKPPPNRTPPPSPPVASNNSGQYSRPAPPPAANPGPITPVKPPPPSINAYLAGDSTYQGQLSQFHNALAQFLAQEKTNKSRITTDYNTANKALNDQRSLDLKNIQDDYASRGLLTSGLFAGANSDYQKNFLQQIAELTKNRDQSLADLITGQTQFQNQQTADQEAARQEAIRRRAQKYGL